jgi:hypothetical protein|tara:strand:+ start:429 stop:530 length:102 start_codon:yes stop_codon:yes gene_type:complete
LVLAVLAVRVIAVLTAGLEELALLKTVVALLAQ